MFDHCLIPYTYIKDSSELNVKAKTIKYSEENKIVSLWPVASKDLLGRTIKD